MSAVTTKKIKNPGPGALSAKELRKMFLGPYIRGASEEIDASRPELVIHIQPVGPRPMTKVEAQAGMRLPDVARPQGGELDSKVHPRHRIFEDS